MNNFSHIFFILCLSLITNCYSQKIFELDFAPKISENWIVEHSDSISLTKEVERILLLYQAKGYISSYLDTVSVLDNFYKFRLVKGELYEWKNIRFSEEVSKIYERKIQFTPYVNPYEIDEKAKLILSECQNNGFPFAVLFLDSIQINKNKVSGVLDVELNDFFVIDSLIIKGDIKTSSSYIQRVIGVNKGDVYNESKIRDIQKKIQNIPFLEVIRESEVFFTPGKATVALYVKDKGASRFDGILGLNPDEVTGKIGIVGDVKVNLLNAFERGENIILNWEQAKTNTQNYLIKIDYPFLFSSPIGIQTELNYFRQDTSFANLKATGGVSWFINYNQEFTISTQYIQSNSLMDPTLNLLNVPLVNSATTLYYGVTYRFNSLDYRINPRKGIFFSVELYSGRKSIEKDNENQSLDYKKLKEKSNQIKTELSFSYFLPLFKKSTMLLSVKSGNLFGENIFSNELYQIGGLKTIRGFNQQSFLVSNFGILTAEYRYLFERNSAVFGFLDYGFYETKSITEFKTDTPFGFGLGVNFQTGTGIFTLSYGLGKQENNPILIKNGKVHFGFVSLF